MHSESNSELLQAVADEPIRVVLVDDSPFTLASLRYFLGGLGRFVVVGEGKDGLTGLDLASRLQPDLVITDVQMPGLDGLELVERLRQLEPTVRTIVISSNQGEAWHRCSASSGADAFVTKGLLAKELPAVLEALFPVRQGLGSRSPVQV